MITVEIDDYATSLEDLKKMNPIPYSRYKKDYDAVNITNIITPELTLDSFLNVSDDVIIRTFGAKSEEYANVATREIIWYGNVFMGNFDFYNNNCKRGRMYIAHSSDLPSITNRLEQEEYEWKVISDTLQSVFGEPTRIEGYSLIFEFSNTIIKGICYKDNALRNNFIQFEFL